MTRSKIGRATRTAAKPTMVWTKKPRAMAIPIMIYEKIASSF